MYISLLTCSLYLISRVTWTAKNISIKKEKRKMGEVDKKRGKLLVVILFYLTVTTTCCTFFSLTLFLCSRVYARSCVMEYGNAPKWSRRDFRAGIQVRSQWCVMENMQSSLWWFHKSRAYVKIVNSRGSITGNTITTRVAAYITKTNHLFAHSWILNFAVFRICVDFPRKYLQINFKRDLELIERISFMKFK